MNKLKLMTIIGTRPEIIRLSAVIKKCDVYFDQILVHTGQNYDYNLNQVFFEDLGLRAPNFYLDAVGKDLGETIGNIIAKSYALMVEQKPDALLILGDTNSCLSAIAAKRLHIPIFHMEAGNRCFDECLPEETNRRIVDHISDVNMCYSEHARRYLNAEGTAKERTFVTGSPMAEVLHANLAKIEAREVLDARAAGAENLHLLLVGDGMSRESLQALAEELHAGDAVTFYGSVPAEKVPSFTTLADALLISLSDSPDLGLTVPGKLASYMAAGKPVVASMNGAGYEAVKESGGGLVSPACDQAALAANLLALYRMAPEGRAALGAKAKAYYEAHYRRTELLRRLESFTLRGE